MGNPQLGQKRALQHEQDENKKPRQDEKNEKMDVDTKVVDEQVVKAEEKEEGENDEEEQKVEKQVEQQEEPEEGEVDEKEEGEVKDDEDEIMQDNKKEVPPTAAVAATNAAAPSIQSKESPVEETAGSA
jgi:hypothetical protein